MNERLRFPVETLDRALRLPAGCSTPERILAAVAGELPAAEAAGLLEHAASCAACGAELELARAFALPVAESEQDDVAWVVQVARRQANPAPEVATGARVLPMRPRLQSKPFGAAAGWVAAASVLLVAALALVGLRIGRPPALPERPLEDVLRGGTIEWSVPLGTLSELPPELAWRAVGEATLYRIEILDVAGREVAGGEARQPRWALEPSAFETLVSYRVQVTAYDDSGRVVAASEPVELRLDPALR